ncbi:serine hydrolase [Actinomadura litoris]|uniref:serine hydrolase n=1 Tax=Actinomadura litoris TaxID=2678616 RepID=UPI001FA6DD56|nr:serine hydrolase [Actinomadura litoris]
MPGLRSSTLLPVAVLATGALLPLPDASAAPASVCASSAHPTMAKTLGSRIRLALADRAGTESVAVFDRKRGIRCAVAAGRHYDSASVVKATILGGLLRQAADEDRSLTATEKSLAQKMVTRSDNDAASRLWRLVGRARMDRFLKLAGMSHTTLGPSGYWGLTQITAEDEIALLSRYTQHNDLLPDKARAYALGLMNDVIASQRWGAPAGTPAKVTWHVKNGWLPRKGRYWRVHSIGAFDGHGEDYMIVVLTQDTPSMAYGVTTIERVARAVHRTLNPGSRSAEVRNVPDGVWEESDGSVPLDR